MKRIGDLAAELGLELHGDPAVPVDHVASMRDAGPGGLAFLADPRYRRYLADTGAAAVIATAEQAAESPCPVLVAGNPHLAFARAAQLLHPTVVEPGCDPSARIDATARVADGARVEAGAVIEADAVVEAGARIGAGALVGPGARVGADSQLFPRSVVMDGCRIGRNCRLHPGCVIGADGFGYAHDGEGWERVPQVGGVVIEDDVDIGANTTIDRGAIGDTRIGRGVKIDNQVQIGHNVEIGEHTAMAACVGISGSTRIGRFCTIGGAVGMAGHLVIADHVHITGMTQVTKSLKQAGVYSSGTGVEANASWRRNAARFHHLDTLARRVRELERRLDTPEGDG